MNSDTRPIDLPHMRVTREIPLWGLIGFLGFLCAQAVALYYAMERQQAEQIRQGMVQIETAANIKVMASSQLVTEREIMRQDFKQQVLEQRVRVLELGSEKGSKP